MSRTTPAGTRVPIVGAAILRHGQVLAARRDAPPRLAGGWEFPGGKVEPGEHEVDALVRECAEELGVRVQVLDRLGPDLHVPPSGRLRVWTARLVSGEPRPLEDHDELRWLDAEHLDEVPWLPVDRPLLPVLAEVLAAGEPMPGGRVGGAVRVGDTVRRPIGSWTPAVHELLRMLADAGVPAVPRVLGVDSQGRERLSFLPGRTLGDADVVPWAFRSHPVLAEVGSWLRGMHEVTATFPDDRPRTWRRGVLSRREGGVICHHDIGPHNVVLDPRGRLTGVLDWDMAAPGHPLDDVAFAAWQFVLRHGDQEQAEAAGLRALAEGYGVDPVRVLDRVVPRLRGAVAFMRRGAEAGDVGLQRLLRTGIPEATQAGAAAVQARREAIRGILATGS